MRETRGRRFRRSSEDRRDSDGAATAGRPRRVFWAVAFLVLSLAWIVPWSAPASAHAQLSEADPAAGAIREGPDGVSLRFTEPVEAEFDPIKVFGSGGERVDQGTRASPPMTRAWWRWGWRSCRGAPTRWSGA